MNRREFDKTITINISGTGPSFDVHAWASRTGSTKEGTFEIPEPLRDGERSVRSDDSARQAVPDDDAPMPLDPPLVGSLLFDALFTAKIKELYTTAMQTAAGGVRIRLNLTAQGAGAAQLAALPWEMLRPDRTSRPIACDNRSLLVRSMMDLLHEGEVEPVELPLRVLLIASNPRDSDALNLAREATLVAEAFKDVRGVEFVVPRKATIEEIQTTLDASHCHVVHFMGHGGFDSTTGDGQIELENDDRNRVLLTAGEFLAAMQPPGLAIPKLVFLNACKSATVSDRPSAHPFGSVSAQLLRAGVPAVLGMQYPISDRAAIEFAKVFYKRIARGDSVDLAASWARNALFASGSAEWFTPVLLLRPEDGVVFAIRNATTNSSAALSATPSAAASASIASAVVRTDGSPPSPLAPPTPIPTAVASPPAAGPSPFTIFLAATSDSARKRSQLAVALEEKGFDVLPAVPHDPGDYEADRHDQRVRDLAAQAHLFVHLLGNGPGDSVSDDATDAAGEPNTFPVRQVLLGSQLLKPQLLLVSTSLDTVEDTRYRAFLQRQQNMQRDTRHEFEMRVEHLNVTRLVDAVVRKRDQLLLDRARTVQAEQADAAQPIAYVDVGLDELEQAKPLLGHLKARGLFPLTGLADDASDSARNISNTAKQVRESSIVILFYGSKGYEYLTNRFNWFRRLKVADRLRTRIAVFVAPPPKGQPELDAFNDVLVAQGMHGFDASAVDELLKEARA